MIETAAEALDFSALVRPGDSVFWGHGTSEPLVLSRALMRQRSRIGRFNVFLGPTFSDTVVPQQADYVSFRGYCGIGANRDLQAAGVLDVVPCHLSQLPDLIQDGTLGCDVALLQLSGADGAGDYSLGVSSDYMIDAASRARVVVAEVNDSAPWTHGSQLPQGLRIDYVVRTSRPVLELAQRSPSTLERRIAGHVAERIPDRAVLQFGIGAVPQAILCALHDHRDLAVHSGMIGDGVCDLIEAGVITDLFSIELEPFPMDFSLTPEQERIREAVGRICRKFDDDYWLKRDREGGFPSDFHAAFAEAGWLGICIPTEYGGSGLGITEAALMLQTISESGAGMSGCSALHLNIFGLNPVVVYGTEEQKRRMLPPLIAGKERACFVVTEPSVGLNTTQLKTKAERHGDHYLLNGAKVWISSAQVAEKMLILARTTPLDKVKSPKQGLSLFYTDLDRKHIEVREIEKMGRKAVDSNQFFVDNLRVPIEDRIGEEGKGFEYILDGMNPERILVAAEAIGLGRIALRKATEYSKERIVFNRPIGKNQGIQHPLARNWIELEAANLLMLSAAWQYDQKMPCGAAANSAKYLAAEAGFRACENAIMTHGGFGYAKEYHVERYLREVLIPRIAPISPQLVLSYVAEKVLGLPKSY